MKTMTCRELGGACNETFSANTFEEMAQLSQQHGMEMYEQQDEPHLVAMAAMQELMADTEAMKQWFEEKRQAFEALADD